MRGTQQSRSELFSGHHNPRLERMGERNHAKTWRIVAFVSLVFIAVALACPLKSQVPSRDPDFRRTSQGWEKAEGEKWGEYETPVLKPKKPDGFLTVVWPFSTAISIGCFCYLLLSCGPSWRKIGQKIGKFNTNLKGVELNHN